MDNKNNIYEVAIVICTYNPVWKKLKESVDSCLIQENLNFQIIISDDGSNNNYFDELEKYFKQLNFNDYILLPSEKNQGTVKNLLKGTIAAESTYIRGLSPGDLLYNNTVMREWIDHLKLSNKRWSFSNAIYYYKNDEENVIFVRKKAQPQNIKPYKKNENRKCRWNYLVLKDIALGATMLAERVLYLDYLYKIMDKVIYAEDNIWRMLMFDGIVGDYYETNTILYEYGTGISTNGSAIWKQKIKDDWLSTDKLIMSNIDKTDKFQCRMAKGIVAGHEKNKITKFLKMPSKMVLLKSWVRNKTFVRFTTVNNGG